MLPVTGISLYFINLSCTLFFDWSGGRFHLHYNQKTIDGDMGLVLTSYAMLLIIGHPWVCFGVDWSGSRFHLHYSWKSRHGDMGVVLTSYTWYQSSGHYFILLTSGVLCCWLKRRQISSSLQPENQTWGDGRCFNFLFAVDWSRGRFHLHFNQKTRHGDMGVV